ncbi:hypothetical protein HanLR1_Chr10g0368651 [Helianthus annuus]|nr:hypothetical protein HanHA89_Chr10g0391251 [Helianthus annuus]KAJ0697414.1 hypothetical protein HanLR1_Chr10g0368651 [Helianthus annuus]
MCSWNHWFNLSSLINQLFLSHLIARETASGYIGENTQPFFVALPKERTAVSNDEFRRHISQVDSDVIPHLKENVKGGYDEENTNPT